MRLITILAGAALLLASLANAQVINGEGTYEGSTLHNPPPEPDVDASKAKVPNKTGETKVTRPKPHD